MATVEVKASELSEISPESITELISRGRNHLSSFPDNLYHIKIPPGTFDWSGSTKDFAQLVVDRVVASPLGGLRVSGEHNELTAIVWPQTYRWFRIRESAGVIFSDMRWTCPTLKVTQGRVIAAFYPYVVFEIEPGFPTPVDIFDPTTDGGRGDDRWMNAFTDDEYPTLIREPWNNQRPWDLPKEIGPTLDGRSTIWSVQFDRRPKIKTPFIVGTYLGLTSKNDGGGVLIGEGERCGFENMWFEHATRVKFFGTDQPIFVGNVVKRFKPEGAVRFAHYSSPGGGPQFDRITNPIVKNNRIERTGDDPMAFFNVNSGSIENNYIDVGRDRSTLMENSRGLQLINHTIINGKVMYRDGPDANGKWTDELVDPPLGSVTSIPSTKKKKR
jgi:hypothetical protein